MRRLLALLLVLPACDATLADGQLGTTLSDGGADDLGDASGSDDAPPDAPRMFGAPQKHSAASSPTLAEDDGSLTSDGLEMVFSITDAADANNKHLWATRRASLTDAWSTPTRLAINQTGVSDETPRFADAGLTLYFASGRNGGTSLDIWRSTRANLTAAWGAPTIVSGVNTAALEKTYTPCGGKYVVIVTGDIREGTVGLTPTVIPGINDAATAETGPFLTPDCLTLYFASGRNGTQQIFTSSRASMTAAWSAPVLYTEYLEGGALAGGHEDPWFSDDGRIFSFAVLQPGGTKDQYIVTR